MSRMKQCFCIGQNGIGNTRRKIIAHSFLTLLIFFVHIILELNFAQLSVRGMLVRTSFFDKNRKWKQKMSRWKKSPEITSKQSCNHVIV